MARPKPPGIALMTSSDDAEAQFYEALQRGDIEKLMAVWSDDDEICCVHPGGPRVVGPAAKRALPPPLQRRLERLASRGLVRDTLPADVRAEVLEHFRSDIALLGELIGQDLSTRWR